MSKLASHINLFRSHDNTGYLIKYIEPVLYILDQNQSMVFIAVSPRTGVGFNTLRNLLKV